MSAGLSAKPAAALHTLDWTERSRSKLTLSPPLYFLFDVLITIKPAAALHLSPSYLLPPKCDSVSGLFRKLSGALFLPEHILANMAII